MQLFGTNACAARSMPTLNDMSFIAAIVWVGLCVHQWTNIHVWQLYTWNYIHNRIVWKTFLMNRPVNSSNCQRYFVTMIRKGLQRTSKHLPSSVLAFAPNVRESISKRSIFREQSESTHLNWNELCMCETNFNRVWRKDIDGIEKIIQREKYLRRSKKRKINIKVSAKKSCKKLDSSRARIRLEIAVRGECAK